MLHHMEPNETKRLARTRLMWAVLYLAALVLVLSTLGRETEQWRIIFRVLLSLLFAFRVYQYGSAWYRLRKEAEQG